MDVRKILEARRHFKAGMLKRLRREVRGKPVEKPAAARPEEAA
jgi:hypothetical protein